MDIKSGKEDNNCEVLHDEKTCNGTGMSWAGSVPYKEDEIFTLLEKIKKASNAETHSIKWRRSLILSTLLVYTVVCPNFVFGFSGSNDRGYEKEDFGICIGNFCLPDWRGVYILIAIFFLILYFTYDYYSYHIYSKPRENIRTGVEYIKNKIKQSTNSYPHN